MSLDYGFETTDDLPKEVIGLPLGTYKVMAVNEEPATDKDTQEATGVIVEYEVVSGENKGVKKKVWYLTMHKNPQTANIAKANLKRLADATGKPISNTSPIVGRVFTATVGLQKNNDSYSEIKKYEPENAVTAPF